MARVEPSDQMAMYNECRKKDLEESFNIMELRTKALEAQKAEHLKEVKFIDDDLEDVDATVSQLFVEYQEVLDALSQGGEK